MAVKFLDFWAPWCGPCNMMKPVIEELEEEYKGKVDFVKINVDEDNDTPTKYGVMGIPTFIVEKDNKEIARKTGVTSKEELKKLIG